MTTINLIGLGSGPDSGNGDPLRTGGQKINTSLTNLNTDKLEKALTDSQIFVGNVTNVATGVAMSGEAIIANTGAVTLTNDSIIAKILTGFTSGAGVITSADSILEAIQKLDGNITTESLWDRSGTDLFAQNAGDNVDLRTGGLKDTNVTTAINLGDASNTSLVTFNKTLVGALNELKRLYSAWAMEAEQLSSYYNNAPATVTLATAGAGDLQTAINTLVDGDILEIQTNANYNSITIPASKRIAIRVSEGYDVELNLAQGVTLSNLSANVFLSGFIFDSNPSGDTGKGSAVCFEHQAIVDHIIFHNCTFRNNNYSAVLLAYHQSIGGDNYATANLLSEFSSKIAFLDCHFNKSASEVTEGGAITIRGCDLVYINNCKLNNQDVSRCIQLQNCTNYLVIGNEVIRAGGGGNGEGIKIDRLGSPTYYNNGMIAGNKVYACIEGIDVDDNDYSLLLGNIVSHCSAEGISVDNDSTANIIGNITYNNYDGIRAELGAVVNLKHNVSFNNTNQDYRMDNSYVVDDSNSTSISDTFIGADKIPYDNTVSGYTSTLLNDVIDEIEPLYAKLLGRNGGQILNGGTLTTQTLALYNNAIDTLGFVINADGSLSVNATDYETLVTDDDDIPNKKYVDDAVSGENIWDRITGTPNYVVPHTTADDIGATGARITKGWFADLEVTNMPTVNGTSINSNGVLSLTSSEVTQLANIDANVISSAQWGYLAGMNQGVATTDSPSFVAITTDTISEKTLNNGVAIEGLHYENDYINKSGADNLGLTFDASDNATLTQNLTVTGNLFVNGDKVAVDSRISTSDYILAMNFGETGATVTSGRCGIETDRGSGNPYVNMFFEANDDYRIGEYYITVNYTGKTGSFNLNDEVKQQTTNATGYVVSDSGSALKLKVVKGTFTDTYVIDNQTTTGSCTQSGALVLTDSTQAVATRQDTPTDTAIAFWNASAFRMDTSANLTWNGSNLYVNGTAQITGNMIIGNGSADVDYTLTFDGETNDGVITWLEDEDTFDMSCSLRLNGGNAINEFSIDGTLAGDSDSAVPTEKAVKYYVDNAISAENFWDRSGTTLSPHNANDKINVTASSAYQIGSSDFIKSINSSGILIGFSAGGSSITTASPILIGFQSGYSTTTGNNIGIGSNTLYYTTTGTSNIAIGSESLRDTVGGDENIALGTQSLLNNISGSYNVAIGTQALEKYTGSQCVAMGLYSLKNNISGTKNVALGTKALYVSTSSDSTAIGFESGKALTTGTGDFFGYNAGGDAIVQTNITCIGNNSAIGSHGNDSLVLGNSTQTVYIDGSGGLKITKNIVANAHYNLNVGTIIENTASRLQIIGDDATDTGSALTLSTVVASNDNKHWTMYHNPTTNTLDFKYTTTTASGTDVAPLVVGQVCSWSFDHLTMANDAYIATDKTRARDADGLLLEDDGGNLGIFIADGGNVKLNLGGYVNEFSIDGTLAGNSDLAVPTEKAVKTYVDTGLTNIGYVSAPALPNSTGKQGQWSYSSGYSYKCVATDTWVRWAVVTSWS